MILLMKQEILESYITYIFDFFQKSRCFKAGQGNMLRNFRFAAEKQFTRNQLGILEKTVKVTPKKRRKMTPKS